MRGYARSLGADPVRWRPHGRAQDAEARRVETGDLRGNGMEGKARDQRFMRRCRSTGVAGRSAGTMRGVERLKSFPSEAETRCGLAIAANWIGALPACAWAATNGAGKGLEGAAWQVHVEPATAPAHDSESVEPDGQQQQAIEAASGAQAKAAPDDITAMTSANTPVRSRANPAISLIRFMGRVYQQSGGLSTILNTPDSPDS